MKIFIITGSLFMALTVLTGAFVAHSLKHKLSMENMKIFENPKKIFAYREALDSSELIVFDVGLLLDTL